MPLVIYCDDVIFAAQTLGTMLLLAVCTTAAVLSTLTLNHPKWHACDSDYWERKCRLKRGFEGYSNFLAHAGLLLPSVIHQTISKDQLGKGRILIIGDIHGCRDEFLELLDKANFKQGHDTLILAGDLVDKGPYSRQVLQEARRLDAWSVRGNHDDTALAAYEDHARGHGVKEQHKWVKDLHRKQVEFLSELPWSISIPSHNIIVVHAGMVPRIPLGRQLLVDLNHMREVGPGDDTKYRGIEGKPERGEGKPWARVWNGPEHIVFGHDHKRGLQEEAFATGLDTGAVHGLHLTGLLLPSAEAVTNLYTSGNGTVSSLLDTLGGRFITVKSKRNYVKDSRQ